MAGGTTFPCKIHCRGKCWWLECQIVEDEKSCPIGFIVIRHGFEIFMLKKITRNGNWRDIETEYKLTR